jgi:hypothetical protein
MKIKSVIVYLAIIEVILVLLSSFSAIILDDGGSIYQFTSLRGEQIEIYGGAGLYRYDTVIKAVMFRGFDWANLFLSIPLLCIGILLYKRDLFIGRILLGALFTYLAYGYLIGVLGNAYNGLFFVWIGMYSIGLFGLALIVFELLRKDIKNYLRDKFPRKTLAVYMFFLGIMLPLLYIQEILSAELSSVIPKSLGIYTTLDLAALEIGIMFPLHILGGVLLLKKNSSGYLISILLVITACIMFVSLSCYQTILYFEYDQGGLFEIIQMCCFTIFSSILSIAVIKNIYKRKI